MRKNNQLRLSSKSNTVTCSLLHHDLNDTTSLLFVLIVLKLYMFFCLFLHCVLVYLFTFLLSCHVCYLFLCVLRVRFSY